MWKLEFLFIVLSSFVVSLLSHLISTLSLHLLHC
ncbi:uncharacterized protein J3R85_015235 [Psidium guajava]|nr:uncharacterized protein J3R85_015235 [Psidium guajava]